MNTIVKYLILSLLLSISLCALCATSNIELNGINYSIYGNSATVIKKNDGSKYSGSIVIPDSIIYSGNTYYVRYINSSFVNCDELESIILPNTLYQLGLFTGCTKLSNMIIPDNITTISKDAFSGCTSLESIIIGSNIKEVGQYAFSGCKNLKSVYIRNLEAWCNIVFYTTNRSAYLPYTYTFNSNPLQNGADLYLNGEK